MKSELTGEGRLPLPACLGCPLPGGGGAPGCRGGSPSWHRGTAAGRGKLRLWARQRCHGAQPSLSTRGRESSHLDPCVASSRGGLRAGFGQTLSRKAVWDFCPGPCAWGGGAASVAPALLRRSCNAELPGRVQPGPGASPLPRTGQMCPSGHCSSLSAHAHLHCNIWHFLPAWNTRLPG